MKNWLLVLVLVGPCAWGQPLFQGYLLTNGAPRFVLSNAAKTSGWLAIGHDFEGYRLVRFDRKTEELVVEKDDREFTLRLPDGKVGDGTTEAQARNTVAPERVMIEVDGKGTLSMEGLSLTPDALKQKLSELAPRVPQPEIVFRAPANIPREQMKDIAMLAVGTGFKRVIAVYAH
jgi:biopolymer transport protein ExbD